MRIEIDVDAARAWLAQPPQAYVAVALACVAALVAYSLVGGLAYGLIAHPRLLRTCARNAQCVVRNVDRCRKTCGPAAFISAIWPIYMAWLTVRYAVWLPIAIGLWLARGGKESERI